MGYARIRLIIAGARTLMRAFVHLDSPSPAGHGPNPHILVSFSNRPVRHRWGTYHDGNNPKGTANG